MIRILETGIRLMDGRSALKPIKPRHSIMRIRMRTSLLVSTTKYQYRVKIMLIAAQGTWIIKEFGADISRDGVIEIDELALPKRNDWVGLPWFA
jgi:hypothetical protein